MTKCLRQRFDQPYDALYDAAEHPGLWFDRFLDQQVLIGQTQKAYETHVEDVAHIGEPALYKAFFARWLATLDGLGARPRLARATSRLAVGHGRESVIETGLTLHHTYGVPYIPGSSLKGVAAGFAHGRLGGPWQRGQSAHTTLFGATTTAPAASVGYVDFLDALPLPGEWQLARDVLTVHHPRYYRGEAAAPADYDDPTPISFLTATGTFLIALRASPEAEAWAEAAYGITAKALEEEGVGGKTSSGYGRLKLGAPLPRLAAGAMLRATVTEIKGNGDVVLTWREPLLLGLPAHKEADIRIPREAVGNYPFRGYKKLDVVVTEVVEDEYEVLVFCRRPTHEEQQAAGRV